MAKLNTLAELPVEIVTVKSETQKTKSTVNYHCVVIAKVKEEAAKWLANKPNITTEDWKEFFGL